MADDLLDSNGTKLSLPKGWQQTEEYKETLEMVCKDTFSKPEGNKDIIGECPAKKKKKKKKDQNKCQFSELKVTSGKKSVAITDDKGHAWGVDKESLDLVAGYDSNLQNVKIALSGTGSCDKHVHDRKIEVLNYNLSPADVYGATSASFDARSRKIDGIMGYSIEKLWPFMVDPMLYEVIGVSCSKSSTTYVRVFPDIKWKGGWSFKYDDKKGKIEFEKFSIAFKYNGKEKTWEKSAGQKEALLEKIFNFLDRVQKLIDFLKNVKEKYAELVGAEEDKTYGWHVMPIAIEVEFEWGWEQDEKTTLCKYPVSLKLALNPLIGITYKGDVLSWISNLWGPFGRMINYIRTHNARVVLKLDFEFCGKISKSGKIALVLNKNVTPEPKKLEVEGSASAENASLGIKLTGSAELNVFIVKFGAIISGECSFSIDVQIGFDHDGAWAQFPRTFSGLVITGVLYKDSDVSESGSSEGIEDRRKVQTKKKSVSKELVKIGEKTWGGEKEYVNK